MDQPRSERREFLRIDINGKVYNRWEDVPPEYRALLQDKNGNGVPDILEPHDGAAKRHIQIERRIVNSTSMSDRDIQRLLAQGGDGEEDHPERFGVSFPVQTIYEHLRWMVTTIILAIIFAVIIVWTLRSYIL